MNRPKIHLVTYATRRFRHRQWILGASARLNRVVDQVHAWSPEKVAAAGFSKVAPDIRLDERGSGFWAWKPFIVQEILSRVPDGDLVFYCDVGRTYPFKLLDASISPFLEWMKQNGQDVMPGVYIPWKGPMSMWTKRDALVLTDMDRPEVHQANPIQASFSIWKAGPRSRALIANWMDSCARRQLVSDDPSRCGVPELPDFHDHRHDQTLLTLCCLRENVKGLDVGQTLPPIDTQHPLEIAHRLWPNAVRKASIMGRILRMLIWPIETVEGRLRSKISFGEPLPEPPSLVSQQSHKS